MGIRTTLLKRKYTNWFNYQNIAIWQQWVVKESLINLISIYIFYHPVAFQTLLLVVLRWKTPILSNPFSSLIRFSLSMSHLFRFWLATSRGDCPCKIQIYTGGQTFHCLFKGLMKMNNAMLQFVQCYQPWQVNQANTLTKTITTTTVMTCKQLSAQSQKDS